MSREAKRLHWRQPKQKANVCLGGMPRDEHTNSPSVWRSSFRLWCPGCASWLAHHPAELTEALVREIVR